MFKTDKEKFLFLIFDNDFKWLRNWTTMALPWVYLSQFLRQLIDYIIKIDMIP